MTRAHLYFGETHRLAAGATKVGLRSGRTGLRLGQVSAALLITVVLAIFCFRADEVAAQSSSVSLALFAPGLLAAYLARPGEHEMARQLYRFPRYALSVVAGAALVAAAALVIWSVDPARTVVGPAIKSDVVSTLSGQVAKGKLTGTMSGQVSGGELNLTIDGTSASPSALLQPTLALTALAALIATLVLVVSLALPRAAPNLEETA